MVQATGANGQPIIATPSGSIVVQAALSLPPGTSVSLEVVAQQAPQLTAPPTLAGTAGSVPLNALVSESLALLTRGNAEAAARLAATTPGPDARMLANILTVAQAVRANDTRVWPGADAMRALERLGPRGGDVAKRLGSGVRDAATTVRDPGGDWRVMSMPFGLGGAIERIQIVTRRHGQEDPEGGARGRGRGGERFLINLSLSRLGAFQLDGLYKKKDRHLDLIVRTTTPLPKPIRQDIQGIFARAAIALDLRGGLGFQVRDRFPGPPPQDGPPPPTGDDGLIA